MIHTFELEMMITAREYDSYTKNLHNNSLKFYVCNNNDSVSSKLYEKVFIIDQNINFQVHIVKMVTDYKSIYKLKCRINPNSIVYEDSIHVSDTSTCLEGLEIIDGLFAKAGLTNIECSKFIVTRIDYAFDINMGNLDLIEKYMQLIKRGNILKNYYLYKKYSYSSHRRISCKDSQYLISPAVKINIYNKYKELLEHRKIPEESLRDKKIIRFEIQCLQEKVRGISRAFNFRSKSIYEFINPDIARYILEYYISRTCFVGDYYTLPIALNIINNSFYTTANKENLCLFLKIVSQYRGYENAKPYLSNIFSEQDMNRLILRLNEIGVNPVTIPLAFNVDCMDNPLNYIRF